jgi:hypothetical protein
LVANPTWSDAGCLQALGVTGPRPGQVQLPVNQPVPGIGGVDEVHGHLGVFDPTGGAGVLALHPNGGGAALEVAGLVDDQHCLGVAQVLDEVGADVIAHAVVVPHRPGEQVLHPIRGGIAGVLGDRPAVLAWQVSDQAAHERPGPPAKVHPSEPTCDPAQHLVELLLPAGRVYV